MKTTNLENEISKYLKDNWVVVNQTNKYCQFKKTKGPDTGLGIFLCILFLIPGILYFCFYKSTEYKYIEVDDEGKVINSIFKEDVTLTSRQEYLNSNKPTSTDDTQEWLFFTIISVIVFLIIIYVLYINLYT